jgi:hypothetical protein
MPAVSAPEILPEAIVGLPESVLRVITVLTSA